MPVQAAVRQDLGARHASALLAFVVLAWGVNWTVNKALLGHVSPWWASASRSLLACVLLWAVCLARGLIVRPARADLPLILSVALLHMVAFSLLASLGLQHLPAGRSVVLAYTTPLWVLPAARLFLGEALGWRRVTALLAGLAALLVLLRPSAFDWHDPATLTGHGLILAAALCWAGCIVYGRAHRGTTTAFALLPWQILLATIVLTAVAWAIEGWPGLPAEAQFWGLLGYTSGIGTVLAYWAMNTVNRGLPASLTAMALLGVPLVGLLFASVMLNEPFELDLLLAALLIIAGVALAARPAARRP